jgi:hypothetical protein
MSDLEKKVRSAKTLLAYGWFDIPEGHLVLADLEKAFGTNLPTFVPVADGSFDPIRAAVRDGQRQVILHIKAMATKAHETSNSAPKTKSRKD